MQWSINALAEGRPGENHFSVMNSDIKSISLLGHVEHQIRVLPETGSTDEGQGQVITSHSYFGMQSLVPALDTCFWHNLSHIKD